MTSPALSAKLKFLTESAYLLSETAPATSSFLQHHLDSLLESSDLTPPSSRETEVCPACGHLTILGTSIRRISPRVDTKRRNQRTASAGPIDRMLAVTCSRCHKKTQHPISPGKMTHKTTHKTKGATQTVKLSPVRTADRQPSPDVSVQNVQTAAPPRNRKSKKIRGLKALLAQSKSSSGLKQGASDFGLDLMDIMKTV